jgi:hypothetical protein
MKPTVASSLPEHNPFFTPRNWSFGRVAFQRRNKGKIPASAPSQAALNGPTCPPKQCEGGSGPPPQLCPSAAGHNIARLEGRRALAKNIKRRYASLPVRFHPPRRLPCPASSQKKRMWDQAGQPGITRDDPGQIVPSGFSCPSSTPRPLPLRKDWPCAGTKNYYPPALCFIVFYRVASDHPDVSPFSNWVQAPPAFARNIPLRS